MRTQRKRGDVYTARAEGPEGGGRAPGAPEAPDALDISVFRFTLGEYARDLVWSGAVLYLFSVEL